MIDATMLATELSRLKDFQRRTVDYVFHRMYDDTPPARRFLVADEVGLGKTMVARGLIARSVHRLQADVPRIDIIYVCSNAAIAAQNLRRLDVFGGQHTALATRLTLLPTQVASLARNRINFVSFTPGTTFDLKSRGGKAEERVVLYRLLVGRFGLRDTQLRNVLQATASPDAWAQRLSDARGPISEELAELFRSWLSSSPVLSDLQATCQRFARRRTSDRLAAEDWEAQFRVIGALRQGLARQCVNALEPDLVIIDEFQRFKHLLHGEDEAAELAQQLFQHPGARVLLLSATPYRMLTLSHEPDENHHQDFMETVRFLCDDGGQAAARLSSALGDLRRDLLRAPAGSGECTSEARREVESILRKVMCRTERVPRSRGRDAMLVERRTVTKVTAADVACAVEVDRISQLVGAGDAVEYWKSAPYLLNFMEGYELKQRLTSTAAADGGQVATRVAAMASMLRKSQFENYERIDPANARLRALMEDSLEAGSWRLLWLPPAVPYIRASGPYAGLGESGVTKALVFSSWNVVPKALAVMLSYEAERRMVGLAPGNVSYERLGRERRGLLTFRLDADGRPAGMPALALLYPCATLAAHVDPLALALEMGHGEPAPLEDLREKIAARTKPLVDRLVIKHGGAQDGGAVDQRWYWAIGPLLDAQHHPSVITWAAGDLGLRATFRDEDEEAVTETADDEEESSSGFSRHVDELMRVARGEERLGRVPPDLGSVVADFALASPAVCAARAILRVSHLSSAWDEHVLEAAAHVAAGFRTLFNVPESISLLRGDDAASPYWRRVLEYCVDGNLQAVLDEYAHLLVESTGCVAGTPADVVATKVSRTMKSALSPRASTAVVDEVRAEDGSVEVLPFRVRCRYAMRFGDVRDDDDSTVARAETVRDAFNSPFRPFVLASTSIGQEGLDFHSYCHAVYHWNLPSNPVDLEQREGRVHRYKGHAVRRNLGLRYGLPALAHRWGGEGDPWARLFELAALDRPAGANELMPYWVFETDGGVQVERRIPLLPLSREVQQIEVLKRQLAVYRLAFGQARQDDLLAYLAELELSPEAVDAWCISLEPGPREPAGAQAVAAERLEEAVDAE